MHYLLFVGLALWVAFLVPVKITVAIVAFVIFLTSLIRYTAFSVSSTRISLEDSTKAIAASLFYMLIALLTLFSFYKGNGLGGIPVALISGALFLSFVTGLSHCLKLTLVHSALIALVSTVMSTGAIVVVRRYL